MSAINEAEFEALGEVKTILQKACDRQWGDETLYQTANIVSNAIFWRNKEIEGLKSQRDALKAALAKSCDGQRDDPELFLCERANKAEKHRKELLTALHEIDMYGNGTIDSKDQTAYMDLMRCGSIARAALKITP